MAYHRGRGISFGGVHDVEESEEGINSEFFNGLFAWNIDRNRFFPLALRKPRVMQRKPQANDRGGRRGRGQANEDELLRNLAALRTGKSLDDMDDMDVDTVKDSVADVELSAKEVLMEFPHPRFNAQLAVQDDTLFIYGGTYEKGDREYTFDEMYAIDLGKLEGVKQIFRRDLENWVGSDDEEFEDDSEMETDDEDDDEEQDEGGDVIMADEKSLHSESHRKPKLKEKVEEASLESEAASTLTTEAFDDTPDDTTSATTADDRPQPRPFESRREFFQRTGNEWQDLLMTSLRWKGIPPETLSVKEIKTKAFEMSEEKWWDAREEITALEDEQEASGIGEMVTLADRGDAGGVGKRR